MRQPGALNPLNRETLNLGHPMITQIFVVLVYLLILAFLAWHGFRKTRTASDYLIAGRNIHPYVMALSYGATFISTSAIVGFGGAAAVFGLGLLWLTVLNISVGIGIAFIFFGARTRRMGHHLGAHTFPELLGKRFDSRFTQIFSGAVVFLFMPLYAAVVMMGAARFLETQFQMGYTTALLVFAVIIAVYVIMGGLKGVMFTDAFQGSVMFIGMTILLGYTFVRLGGFTAAHQALTDLPVPPSMAAQGHQGWTAMPAAGSAYWWTLVSTIVMGVGIGVLAQPQLVVRFMTVKSDRELNRAVLIGGVFILMMTGVAFVVGALSNVYFVRHPDFGRIAIAAAGSNVERVIPLFVSTAMPAWFSILFMLTLLSAAMSTLSSQFHTMGSAIGRDICEAAVDRPAVHDASAFITKVGVAVAILIATFLAWWLPHSYKEAGEAIIARGTAIFFGLCAATFLPAYAGGLYTRGITRAGVIAGMLSGFFSSAFWLLFGHRAESASLLLCDALFKKPCLMQYFDAGSERWVSYVTGPIMWAEVDPLFIGLPLSIVVTIGVSLVTRKYSKEHLDNCYHGFKAHHAR